MASGVDVEQLSVVVGMRAASEDAVALLVAAVQVADDVCCVADALLDHYVTAARADGRSWSEIGAALGVSKQAAQQRFVGAPAVPTAWPKHFDEDARAVVDAAQRHARQLHHRSLGTEHLLLALTADTGLAGTTLVRLGVSADRVTERIRTTVGEGHASESATLGISPRTKRVLEAAGHHARELGHRCAAPEHLLLALSGERDTSAAHLLHDIGVSDQQVRTQLSELLAGEAPELAEKIRQPPRGRVRLGPRRRRTR